MPFFQSGALGPCHNDDLGRGWDSRESASAGGGRTCAQLTIQRRAGPFLTGQKRAPLVDLSARTRHSVTMRHWRRRRRGTRPRPGGTAAARQTPLIKTCADHKPARPPPTLFPLPLLRNIAPQVAQTPVVGRRLWVGVRRVGRRLEQRVGRVGRRLVRCRVGRVQRVGVVGGGRCGQRLSATSKGAIKKQETRTPFCPALVP